MKKKKIKLWKKILIVISIILLIFIIINVRKIFIISSLNKKIAKYEECQNCYYLMNQTTLNKKDNKIIEMYKKDNVVKYITRFGKIITTEFVYPNERKTYLQIPGRKEMSLQETEQDQRVIPNFLEGLDKISLETITDYIRIKIITEKLDGKDCYVIYNSDAKVYFDKDSGLVIKVELFFDDETYTITYEYNFNEVTDKDMEEPDASDYNVISSGKLISIY